MKNSVFNSPSDRDQFRAQYNLILSQFPFEQRSIETAYGKTFILSAGQESNPPVILLHGSCSNSAFWFPEIMALSNRYRVYAVDILGEAGNSEEYRPDLDSDVFALWMRDVFHALNIEKAVLIGNSLGGWMGLKFAAAFPEHVSKLILIAAAGLAEVRRQFLLDVEQTRQEDGTVPMTPDIIGEYNIPREVLDFMNLIVQSYNPIQTLPVFEDEPLLRLTMPVLFIDGENDAIIDAKASAQRLARLLPSAEIRLIPNTGHVVTNSLEYVTPFLKRY